MSRVCIPLFAHALLDCLLVREAPPALPIHFPHFVTRVATMRWIGRGTIAAAAIVSWHSFQVRIAQTRHKGGDLMVDVCFSITSLLPCSPGRERCEALTQLANRLLVACCRRRLESCRCIGDIIDEVLHRTILVSSVDVSRSNEASDVIFKDREANAQCLVQVGTAEPSTVGSRSKFLDMACRFERTTSR